MVSAPTSVRLPPHLKKALQREAARERRSLSTYIMLVLEEQIRRIEASRQVAGEPRK